MGKIKSVKNELIKKSREAILAAVQIYNNPQITFKAEAFITLSIIAWTYLMHAYYRNQKIDYRYFELRGTRKRYDKTKNGAEKHWELERCINNDHCPLDYSTKNNLRFLIGIRHEIEHQMTNKIDEFLSAKLQACAMNYDYYIKQLFGEKNSVSRELALSIQFSAIIPQQEQDLFNNEKLTFNIRNFIASFEHGLSKDEIINPRYAYRVLYVPVNAKRPNQADSVIEFVKPDSELANDIERVLIKETEKNKYIPSEIVTLMKQEGYTKFSMHHHTVLWKLLDAKNKNKHFGVKVSKNWYWYDSWLTEVRKHCYENKTQYK